MDNGTRHILIGTVGYHCLRDYSVGPMLLPHLQEMSWPAGVEVDELNWGPIAIVQRFQAEETPFERVVILTARDQGRPPGTLTLRRWRGGLPDDERLQARVAEAVTGVISVDNLLIIGEHFDIWPDETFLVDVEPGPEEAGETFTPAVESAVPDILDTVRHAALAPSDDLPAMEALHGHAMGAFRAN